MPLKSSNIKVALVAVNIFSSVILRMMVVDKFEVASPDVTDAETISYVTVHCFVRFIELFCKEDLFPRNPGRRRRV